MKAIKEKPKSSALSSGTARLLAELGEECQHVLKLLARLNMPGLSNAQVEAVLGELSAAIVHLHEHTRGLDAILDEDRGEG